jgi:hypothetical protein
MEEEHKKGERSVLKADGFDHCIMGLGRIANTFSIAYDEDKVISTLCDRDGMSLDDAREYFEFNIASAFVGDGTPTFVRFMSLEHILEQAEGV